jgi:hypothetical protein
MELSILTDLGVNQLIHHKCNVSIDRVLEWRDVSCDTKPGECEFLIQFNYIGNQDNPNKCIHETDNWHN